MVDYMISSPVPRIPRGELGHRLYLLSLIVAAVAVPPLSAAAPAPLTEEEAVEKIAQYTNEVAGNPIASFPAAMSRAPQALNSMSALAVGEVCFLAWRNTFQGWVEKGYLSGFEETEQRLALYGKHMTPKGKQYFEAVLPVRFHTCVRITSPLPEAGIRVLSIGPGRRKKDALVEFGWSPSEAYSVMRENRVLGPNCQVQVDPSLVLENGDVRAHAHFRRQGKGWKATKVVLGPHKKKE